VHDDFGLVARCSLVAPVEKFTGGTVIGFAGIRVADVGGEEFDEAPASILRLLRFESYLSSHLSDLKCKSNSEQERP
jgi:hypothetical protein